MIEIAVILFGLFSQFVSSQTATPIPGTPACVLQCSGQFCPTAELQCVCADALSNITSCVLTNCNSADQMAAVSIEPQVCGEMLLIVLVDVNRKFCTIVIRGRQCVHNSNRSKRHEHHHCRECHVNCYVW